MRANPGYCSLLPSHTHLMKTLKKGRTVHLKAMQTLVGFCSSPASCGYASKSQTLSSAARVLELQTAGMCFSPSPTRDQTL